MFWCSDPGVAERRSYVDASDSLAQIVRVCTSQSAKAGESRVLSEPSKTHLHVINISMFKDAFGKKRKLNE